jgi:hypothetical protein
VTKNEKMTNRDEREADRQTDKEGDWKRRVYNEKRRKKKKANGLNRKKGNQNR